MPKLAANRAKLLSALPKLAARGVTDLAISQEWGVSRSTVGNMRSELGLERHKRRVHRAAPGHSRSYRMPRRCPMHAAFVADPAVAAAYRAGV